jgi:hypothetical protein
MTAGAMTAGARAGPRRAGQPPTLGNPMDPGISGLGAAESRIHGVAGRAPVACGTTTWHLNTDQIAMYRVGMDTSARADIAAAAAVHSELGPDYGDAVAEGLIERIGSEIDKRVDARLAQRGPALTPEPAPPQHRSSWAPVALGLGSMLIGLGVASQTLGFRGGGGRELVVVLIWIIIGIVNVAYARRR